jgi:GTP-binding protein
LNKCDLKESENNKDLYYEEGLQNIIEISVTKKQGIRTLEKKIEEILPSTEQAEEGMQSNLRVGIIGKPNAGKSTFFNKLLQAERSLVDKSAGTTRDSISHKLDINKAEIILTDTAGIKRKSKLNDQIDNLITRESINTLKNVDGVVFLIDVHQSISDQDLQIISLCLTSGKPIVIGLNKSENLSKSDKLILKKEINRRLSFASHLESKFISAKKNLGTKALVRGLIKIIKNSRNKISKKELNEILERIVEKNPPPISGRFRPNLKFAQLQSNRPFTISIHGNKLKDISNSYTKYIEKQFRKELDLKGVPIKIFYKTDDNPFKDKKNKLTERQLKKRARIRRR